jgi:phosphoglucosamine mutase
MKSARFRVISGGFLGLGQKDKEALMARRYFGTDGIRGRANGLITPELALKVGQATGLVFHRGEHRHRVVIGKDTRLSCYMLEGALTAGFISAGMDVVLVGPMPTPSTRLAH